MTQKPYSPLENKSLKGHGKIYFVPLGDFPAETVNKLASYYQQKYGILIETLPSISLIPSLKNLDRQQLTAESVIDYMKASNQQLSKDPNSILIGLTSEDMYIAKYDWRFTFSFRQEGRYAVVSDARMILGDSPQTFASVDLRDNRLRKMITKNIGILYYRLQQNSDPKSVLYKDVGGIEELDYMGEEF